MRKTERPPSHSLMSAVTVKQRAKYWRARFQKEAMVCERAGLIQREFSLPDIKELHSLMTTIDARTLSIWMRAAGAIIVAFLTFVAMLCWLRIFEGAWEFGDAARLALGVGIGLFVGLGWASR